MAEQKRVEWFRDGRTVYALDDTGRANRFSARVDGGFSHYSPNGHTSMRTDEAELEAVARLMQAAPDLLRLLAVMFDAYEDGPSCYEDPEECGGFLGHAVRLKEEDFRAIADLLNALDAPRAAISKATSSPQAER